jgi:torulene dioxygenase
VVRGKIPVEAAGILYRVGPGNHKVENTPKGDFSISHWFDGFTHFYRFQLIPTTDGSCKVVYNSRRQVDALIEEVRKTGKLVGFSFGQKRDPCMSFFQKLKCIFEPSRAVPGPEGYNVGVTIRPDVPGFEANSRPDEIGQKTSQLKNLVTFTDASSIKILDPDTLEPVGVADQSKLHPALTGPLSCAHAHYDPVTGDLYNYNLALGRNSTYRIFRVSAATGKTDILATISGSDIKPAYVHSFFLTEEYVVLGIWPAHLAAGGMSMLWERNLLDAISSFNPAAETKWLVVDRKNGRGLVAKFSSPAMFAFHSVNAWQEEADGNTDIYCDLVQYPNLDVLHRFYYENFISSGKGVAKYAEKEMRENVTPSLVRYRLASIPSKGTIPEKELHKAEITMTIPGPSIGELPTMNPKFSSKKARYVYSTADRGHSSLWDSIAKTDLETKEVIYWEHKNHMPGEAIFVPVPADDPTGETEDAGVLLSVILDGDKGSSYLLCLDARDMKELGRAEVDVAVGMGFHGSHTSGPREKL